jgi:dipeptidyl aminopeptidase/acylaminoacyl peptidase
LNFASSQALDAVSATSLQSTIIIDVVNYEQFWQYELRTDSMSLKLVSQSTKDKDADWPVQLPPILKQWDEKNKKRYELAKDLNAIWASGIKWAEKSPDAKYVLVGYEDPDIHPRHAIKIYEITTGVSLKAIKFEETCIEDFVWSPDSKYLLIIEEQERWSKSIKGLLLSITGHPIPLETFTLSILNISTGEIKRIPIAEDIKHGSASISIKH